ncbi:MAG: cytochrome c biogenesis protein ResB [Candidatus Wallbacteria bacterium]
MFKNLKNNIFIKLFNSIPTAIIILCLITAACIAGTLIPQNRGPAFYFQNYGGTIFNFIMIFSLNDLYHSIWFISLLVMLCLNITVCTAMRIKPLFKAAKINDPVIPETLAGNLNIKKEFILQTECNEETTISNISGIIKSSFENKKYKTYDTLKNGTLFIMARRGEYSFIGAVLVHISIIIILCGGIAGNLYGFKNYITVLPGQEFNVPTPECYKIEKEINGIIEKMKFLKIDMRPEIAELMKQRKNLTYKSLFDARVEDFRTEYIKDGSTDEMHIKNWFTLITVLDSGEIKFTSEISVNNPMYYKGINIYQSSFGIDPETGREYTGLQINYDPGVTFIWAGSVLMTIGLFITFNFYNRKIWIAAGTQDTNINSTEYGTAAGQNQINVKMKNEKIKNCQVVIKFYALSNKNRTAFEREFNGITDGIIEKITQKKAE